MKQVTLLLFLFLSTIGFTQLITPFTIRYQVTQKGGIRFLANSSVTCASSTICTNAQGEIPPTGTSRNNNFNQMNYVDYDGLGSTIMSSSDSLALPNCSEISFAGLYWGGIISAGTANYVNRNKVKFRVNSGAYTLLTADQLQDNTVGFNTYHCYKNITGLVQTAGTNARFTIADMISQTGTSNLAGGWTIVVVYKNVLQTTRNLTVFDGLASVNSGAITIPISGFLTPLSGVVNFELGVVAYDGDRGATGDQLKFNGVGTTYLNITDALHPTNDAFNSTIAYNGVLTPFRNPNYYNTLGMDANIFIPNNSGNTFIGNNATSANIQLISTGDIVLTQVVTSAIDVYEPDLRATLTYTDLNGGQIQPNDIIEYKIKCVNIGSDPSVNTFLIDTIDVRTNYVPGSLQIVSGPNAGLKTDGLADDQGEYISATKIVKFRIGTGANGVTGGQVNNSPSGSDSTVVKFRVQVIDDCPLLSCDSTLTNLAYVFGTGNVSGNQYGNNGTPNLYNAQGCPISTSSQLILHPQGCIPPSVWNDGPECVGGILNLYTDSSTNAIYSWTGPNGFTSNLQNPSISNVQVANSGVYNLFISFTGNGCTFNLSSNNIVINPLPTVNPSSTNISCFNGSNGQISLSPNLNAPYTYLWNNASTNSSLTNLIAGNYSVTYTDVNGCTSSSNYTLTQPAVYQVNAVVTSNYNGQQISCFGSTNGSISTTVTGGVGPHIYLWSNGATTANLSNVGAGTFSIITTDANGCNAFDTVIISSPTVLSGLTAITSNFNGSNISCFSAANGAANVTASGGISPYTYLWNNTATTSSISNLIAGTYSVQITDLNLCTTTANITLTQPSILTNSVIQTNVLCNGASTGALNITVTGGTIPYTYLWNNSATTEDLTGLAIGNYSVTITDINGCTKLSNYTITQPTAILPTIVMTPVTCFNGTNGGINLSVSGGTPTYTYLWSTGSTTQDISNRPAGNYSVTITDANGCVSVNNYTITTPAQIIPTMAQVNVLCNGNSTGSLNLSVTGGSGTYTYSWSNGPTTQDQTNLFSGTYIVTITDGANCTANGTYTITQPSALATTVIQTNVLCNGAATGILDISVSGGVSPYTYNWSNGFTTQDVSLLTIGNYTVIITDANGCTYNSTYTITQPSPILATMLSTPVTCFGGTNGILNLTVSGGNSPYSYSWSNGATTQDLSGLNIGTYTVLITDANNCLQTNNYVVNQPALIVINSTQVNVLCNGSSTGSINISVTGGISPYSYSWSNSAISEDLNNISAGTYNVTITDGNNCTANGSYTITQASAIAHSSTQNNVLCFGASTGSINLTVSGGGSPYTYLWSNSATTEDLNLLTAGSYSVVVTDANGCTYNTSFVISQNSQISLSNTVQAVSCFGGNNGSIDLSASGGTFPYTYLWSNTATTQDISTLIAGNYNISFTDANGCIASAVINVPQPANGLSLTQAITNVNCYGQATGSIDLNVTGGTQPYTYIWNTSASTQDITNLPIGNYSVIVTDNNGCSNTLSATITQPIIGMSNTGITTPAACFGQNSGNINLSVFGGTAPYNYSWTNGSFTQDLTNINAGNYTVTIVDANGCTSSGTYTISQPALPLSLNETHQDILCFGTSTGGIDLTVTGGTAAYTYAWSNGLTTEDITNVPFGNYTITVSDAQGCTANTSVIISQLFAPISLNQTHINVACLGGSTGSIDLTVIGGAPTYTYLWSTGAVTQDVGQLSAGSYQVLVTDIHNCSSTLIVQLTQPPTAITFSETHVNNDCASGTTGSIDLTVAGGGVPYAYSWNNGAATQDITNLLTGTYTVQVTDNFGCTQPFSVTILDPANGIAASTINSNVNCYGGADGSIDLTVTGGNPGYTYLWSTGPQSQDLNNLAIGYYSVVITDLAGCQFFVAVQITQPDTSLIVVDSILNVLCFNQTNGAFILTVSGGTPGYNYTWSNGATTQNLYNLPAGTYSGTVTDSNGCTVFVSQIITQPPSAITLASFPTNVICFGTPTGAIDLSVSGGMPNYTYSWNNGATTQDLSNVVAGNYSVTVQDSVGCTEVLLATVTQPIAGVTLQQVTTHVSCFGGNDGSINLSVSAGTAPYTYLWSNGATTQDLYNLTTGIYTVVVLDANNCSISLNVQVNQPATLVSSQIQLNNVTCNNGATGDATATALGGTPPYTFIWSNGQSTAYIDSLIAGIYALTVSDNNGCTAAQSIFISQPLPIVVQSANTNNICYGQAIGTVSVSVIGGTAPYLYLWNNGSTNDSIGNLPAGPYFVTITDDNGCTVTISDTVTQPASPIAISALIVDNICFGYATGTIDITALGGTAPYQYQWNNGTFTQDLTTLLAGTYNVVVMDNNGCLITDSFTVNQPPAAITINSTAIQVACFGGNNASINLTLTGPAAPFDFIWSNGATTEDLFNLSQGAYTVQVSDTNNCTTNATINITQPAAPVSLQTITTNVLCFGNNSGAINLSVFGGTLPYSYTWSNNTGNQDLNNILAGNYNVSVTDANGCSASIAATITQPLAPITTSLVQTNILCFGQATGAIDVSVSGGTPNYTYAWSNNTNAQDIAAVNSGFYALVITDANGCTANVSATLTQPALPVNVAASVTNVSCFNGNNGAIFITVTGGIPSYSFLWSNGETTQNIDTLTNANYALQLTDFNGCYSQWNISVNQPTIPLLLSVIPTDPLCFGGSNGNMDLFVVGGTAPYSYLWNNGATSQDIINLNAGTYSVNVTDANGCTQNIVDTLQQPASFVASTIINNINCYAQNTGSIDLSVSGGTAPYTYLWNNTATTQDITGLLAGIYNVIITDNNGCSITDSSILSQPLIPTNLSVVVTNASCFSASDGAIDLTVVSGNSSFSYLWNNQAVTQDLNNLPSGNYSVIVTDNLGCIDTISAIVAQPNNLVISSIITNPLCSATATGDIDISITGGTAPYSYAWLTGQNTQDISNLSQGIYFLTVTDANGCSQQATFQLTDPSVLIATATFIQPTCPGGSNGSINATITGATAPYSFLWSTGAITEDIFNVSAGNDTLFTTDNNGCIDTLVVSVTQPSPLLTNFITTNIVCFGTQTGAINLSVIGGTAPYTYLWNNGATTQDLSNLNIGQYVVTITDANGCTKTDTTTVLSAASPLALSITGTNISCFLGSNGSINLTITGGVAPYQINWSNSATTEDLFNLPIGTYSVIVVDSNGCTANTSIAISAPIVPFSISATTINVQCLNGNNGDIDLSVSGGAFPFTYAWSNAANTQDIHNLTAGVYSVTVTDFNGCVTYSSYSISQPISAAVISYLSHPVFCFGDSTGWINATVIGGALPYSFAWSNGVNAEDIFNIPSGTYTLTVTDNVNCITTAIVNITQPAAPLFANAIIDNVSCFGLNDASIVVNITGGSPSYILSWSTGDNGNTIDTLSIGNYQLNIIDSLACTLDTTFTITQPATLTISAVITNVACFGDSSAIINVTPLGGTAPFYYTWSNGQTTQDIQNIPIGNYSLVMSDTNGCMDSTQFNITQPLAPIAISSTQVNVGCFGNNSGSVDVSVTGGTPNYSYLWSNNATTQDVITLVAGNYWVIVTDNLLCQDTLNLSITQPQAPLVIIPTITNAPCFGQAGGAININIIGGTQPYSYYWNTTDTTQSLVGIPAGQYSLAVTDSNNCVSSMLFNITQPQTSLAIVVTQVPVSCFGYANGQMNVIAAGGISPYNYLWSNGQNTPTIDSLTAGLYTVTVTDDNGCQVTQNQVLTQPDSLVADFNSNAIFGCIPFEAQLTNNSLGNYASATWTIGNGDQLFNLDTAYYQFNYPGCYDITLTLTSPNGCMATSTQYSAICVVSGPIANFYSNPQEIDFYTGDIQFINTSAGANNNYFWYFGDGTQGQSFSPFHNYPAQTVGTYEVMLVAIDSNGCVDTTLQVYQLNEIIVMNVPNAFTIDDNNLNDSFKPIFSAPESILTYDFSIFNRWGQLIYQTNDPNDAWDGKYLGKFVQTGAYNWTVSYTDINKETRFANGHVVVLK